MPHKNIETGHAYQIAYAATHREERRAYRETHWEERRAYSHAYYVAHRKEIDIYLEAHRDEHRASICAWAKAHPQERAESQRRRRARKYKGIIGPIDLEAIKRRDRMLCCICGKKVTEKDFSLDHTVPLVFGGPHSQENLRVAHRSCNARRGTGRLPVQMVLI